MNNIRLKVILSNRFVLLILFTTIFMVVNFVSTKSILPSTETKDLWFYSGVFMVLFSILFIEPYYTSPKNVITNVIPLLLVFLAIKGVFDNLIFWWFAVLLLLILLVTSILAMALEDKNKSPEHLKNKTSNYIKKWVVIVGQGKVLYSSVFIYFLLTYYSIQNYYTLFLFILWFFVLSINPKKINSTFSIKKKELDKDVIGEIFSVQSKKIFLVKLFEDRKSITKFDVVKFRYSMQDADDLVITGIVFDTYLLNQEKWTKVLQLKHPHKADINLDKNIVYKVSEEDEREKIEKELNLKNFIGVVIEGSKIGKIKFEYSEKHESLQEGDLLELETRGAKLYYQVISGTTENEKLEDRNEMGFIEGEAIQLGEWKGDDLSFQKYGWVPPINTPIFKADTTEVEFESFNYPEYQLGIIPNTTLPSVINLDEAISHHMALLGVTGSGKSFLAREIIKQLKQDTKIICVDFTSEWKKEFESCSLEKTILNKDNIDDFLGAEDKVGIVELPTMSNTVEVITATEKLFSVVFDYAKNSYDEGNKQKICLILEEAHTIVPEANFLGVNNWDSKAVVNKMGQIALQGRKYGVGMLVIAQRTANVSKTVLTQCNTVVCFQAFDETSFNFLGNYVGKDMVGTLPNLKQYHAVVTGKAIRSNLPMIIDLKR